MTATIIHGDVLATPIPRADLVLVDPPYGLGKDYNGARETWSFEDWVEAILTLVSAPWRLFIGPSLDRVDYRRLRPDRVIVWTKTMAQIRKSLAWWQYGLTPILVYREPDAPWYGGSKLPGSWDYIAAASALSEVAVIKRHFQGKHPAVTGTFIARKLIVQLTKPGDLVVDPMAGIGSIPVAAVREGRNAWGCEIDPDYAAAARAWTTAEIAKSGPPVAPK